MMEKIERYSIPVPVTGCWLWEGGISFKGYGAVYVPGVGTRPAHRASYEAFVGPIPEGLHIDHLCRVRCCVNPAHLEPVTPRENVLRGVVGCRDVCRRGGHPMTGHNVIAEGDRRRCRACLRARERRVRARIRCEAA